MTVKEIRGTVTLDDGNEVQFSLVADLGWQQWGNRQEVLGRTVYLMDALASAADEHMESGNDDRKDH